MKIINVEEGQSAAEALAQAGAPDEVINLIGAIMGEKTLCDCPPGVCIGDSEGPTGDLFGFDEEENDDDDLEVHFEPDFFFSDEPEVSVDDKVEAVAQLGRILEGMTVLVDQHAQLLKKLVA